ncbi:MAG TPA: hypothetical protein VFS23_24390 [Vicinamibacterales bacterium]|nr:hypothetical protein [Vicinamibacterales bacterium]
MIDTVLSSPTALQFRIWGEFNTLPGLRLTEDQLCRLMGDDRADVAEALRGLVEAGVLRGIGPYYIRADIDRYTA